MVHTLAEQHGHDRDVHAEAVHAPDGQRLPLPHVALGRRRRTSSSTRTTRAGSASRRRAYHFIGGLKAHARAYSARHRADGQLVQAAQARARPSSGATWSPVWISYGYNNRTQMLRIPGPGRIEDRTIDGSCNPYLAAAAVLAAGLDGIENGLDAGRAELGEPLRDPVRRAHARAGSRRCRRTCSRRSASSSGDDVLRAALGRGARRGLRRLLRPRQARRVVPLPRAGHALGDPRVPDALLGRMEESSISDMCEDRDLRLRFMR